jgi:hypothetical protein
VVLQLHPRSGHLERVLPCLTLRKNGVVIKPSNGANGPSSQNCTGNIYANGPSGETGPIQPDAVNMPLAIGSTYEMCITDFRWSAVIYQFASSAWPEHDD